MNRLRKRTRATLTVQLMAGAASMPNEITFAKLFAGAKGSKREKERGIVSFRERNASIASRFRCPETPRPKERHCQILYRGVCDISRALGRFVRKKISYTNDDIYGKKKKKKKKKKTNLR